MTEKLKTRSEVLKELETAKRIIDGLPGLEVDIITSNGFFVFGVADSEADVISDYIKFTPDPDTKIQALEKAQRLQMEECKTGCYPTIELLTSPENDKSWRVWMENAKSKDFPFADPAPKSEFITDEPPPEGISIIDPNGRHFLSRGHFRGVSKSLIVSNVRGEEWNVLKYKSLTTKHRSKDWEG